MHDMDSGERRILMAKTRFGDALREDFNRSSPALKAVVGFMATAIVVLLASMGAAYIYVTMRIADQAAMERASIREDMRAMHMQQNEQDRVLREELDRWRSLVEVDMDRLRESLITGERPDPLISTARPPMSDAARTGKEP